MLSKTDKLFRRIFMALTTLAAMLAIVLIANLFFSVPLNSKSLWIGSILTYLTVNLVISVSGIYNRLVILFLGILILGVFFVSIIHWPLVPSLIAGMGIMVLCGLFYITFLHG